MVNKLAISFAAVLLGFMSLGYVEANTNDYTVVPQTSETQTVYMDTIEQKNGKTYITVDFIEWYEGEEANVIFREKENDSEMTETPDGYYVVNEEMDLLTFEVAEDAQVLMQIYNRTGNIDEADTIWNEEISVDKFFAELSDTSEMNLKEFPYHLEIHEGTIVKITQQFVP
ncbi:hypothetical protein [Cohnella sp.]|uniref:hypothetical protein n=1 Tax=Cohnella sp. TaxID=1883426 RepID=UPI0035661734